MGSMPRSVQYIKSAYLPDDYPEEKLPEVIITGRSNAGKSSFINAWMGSKVAHVSKTPGKTRLLNFFNVEKRYLIVDSPGYGFAVRSGKEQADWQKLLENYLSHRQALRGVLIIMDIRRDWSEEEEMLKVFCESCHLPVSLILTKADKLTRQQQNDRKKVITEDSNLSTIWICSALKQTGLLEMDEYIYKNWLEPKFTKKESL